MNLVIEYIARRKKLFENLFQTPSSLFLENKNSSERTAIVFEKKEENSISIRRWHLSKRLSNNTINKENFLLEKKYIFNSPLVIVDGFIPIEYKEEPIDNRLNNYNHPIDCDNYSTFYLNFLNSNLHKSFRRDWLWDTFVKMYFGSINSRRLDLSLSERRIHIEKEKIFIKKNHCSYWKKWKVWNYKLIYNETVSNELIFKNYFKKIIHIN